jgi:hypothetical protein
MESVLAMTRRTDEKGDDVEMKTMLNCGSLVVAMCLLALAVSPVCLAGDDWTQPRRPVSTECVKIGPGPKPECQDVYDVWGTGTHSRKEHVDKMALLDARRAACWCTLFGGDGILKTKEQRDRFEALADTFYSETVVSTFVPVAGDIAERVELDRHHRKAKVRVEVVVDHCRIRTWLEDHGCQVTVWNTASIMVLPDVSKGESPVAVLDADPDARQAKTVIENFLTRDGNYEVLEPDAAITIEEIQQATDLIEDNPDDYVYRLAVMQGADIYIRFEVTIENPTVQGQTMQKAAVRLDAYETTTARLIGSQTAYSETRPMSASLKALIEEGISSGAGDILSRIQKHWLAETERGVQYLVILVVSDEVDDDEAIDIQFCFDDCAAQVSQTSKMDAVTAGRIKYRLWVNGEETDNALRLAGALRKCFRSSCPDWSLKPHRYVGKFFGGYIEPAE